MKQLSTLAVLALALLLAPSLLAIPIPLQSTGMGPLIPSPLAGGDVDPDWVITQILNPNPPGSVPSNCPGSTCYAAVVDIPNTVNPPGWVANDANSRWVWVTPAASPTAFDPPSLTVMMETHFSLPSNANLSDVTLAFRMAADDAITAVRVNGVLVPGVNWASFGSFSPLVTINAASFGGPNPFVVGDNVLEFTIVDNQVYGGFRLEVNGAATQYGEVPEPGSLAMLGGGLLALAYGIRRRAVS